MIWEGRVARQILREFVKLGERRVAQHILRELVKLRPVKSMCYGHGTLLRE